MPTNIKAFDAAIGHHIGRDVPQIIKDRTDAVAMSVHRQLVQETPVRTGRMKGNWQITVGGSRPPRKKVRREDKSPRGTVDPGILEAEAAKLAPPRRLGTMIWAHNGVPYAIHVNNGTETQTAQRIVERVADRHRRMRGVS